VPVAVSKPGGGRGQSRLLGAVADVREQDYTWAEIAARLKLEGPAGLSTDTWGPDREGLVTQPPQRQARSRLHTLQPMAFKP